MRKQLVLFLGIVTLLLSFPPKTFADTQQEKMVSIPESQLTDKQKAQVAQQEVTDKVKQYGEWVGVGHEIGTAVNEGLSAVTTQANNFAQTSVGKWTMAIIIFKVAGSKIVGYLVGALMYIIGIPIWIWSYRRYVPKRYISRIKYAADGKTKTEVEYGYTTDKVDNAEEWVFGHWAFMVLMIIIASFTMFSGN